MLLWAVVRVISKSPSRYQPVLAVALSFAITYYCGVFPYEGSGFIMGKNAQNRGQGTGNEHWYVLISYI